MTPPPLRPERLAVLLDDAVQHVTASPDALDRISRGVRRRRSARRSGAVLLAVAVLAGGGSAALTLASGHGPADQAAPSAQQSTAGPAPASTTAYNAAPSAIALAPTPSPGSAAAKAAPPPVASPSAGPSTGAVGRNAPPLCRWAEQGRPPASCTWST